MTIAVHAAQQALLACAVHRHVGFGVLFPVMHTFDCVLNMFIDPAIQDGYQGSHMQVSDVQARHYYMQF